MTDSFIDFWSMKKDGQRNSNRQKEKIRRAIKDNLRELISDSSIITSDGKKKIRIPIRHLDNYHFKHSDNKNKQGTGQGNKDNKPGDPLGNDGSGQKGKGQGQAGDQAGEESYEEITVEELISMMLEDLGLPWLERKENTTEIETENIKFNSISETGPLSNVDKKRTIFENMKRNAKMGKARIHKVHQEDMRFKIWEKEKEYHSNAAVYCLMDRSGSMTDDKKYIAKSFFWYLVHFCKAKYQNVEIVFIAHDTEARIVPEENFFKIASDGGTKCSSAFQLALDTIKEKHPPDRYSNYVVEFSDGDSFGDSNECVDLVKQLLEVCTAVGYGEIDMDGRHSSGYAWSTLHGDFAKGIDNPKFLTYVLQKKEDVYDCLKQFLGTKNE